MWHVHKSYDLGSILKPSAKSDTIECIENSFPEDVNRYFPPKVDTITVDGPAYVHMYPPRRAKTYGGYCDEIVMAISSKVWVLSLTYILFTISEARDKRHKDRNLLSEYQ